ncbi:hypothetical protein BUZ22_03175 [Staphylococcus haemolyticus]|uniref:hypothetical protein n=1 Tax=Staphylococcus TaxID=1279 RepID=UPI000D1D80AF|nr:MULTISPECIES: hypothetical protein [Staphylococcus]PTK42141.1 hypothetical protein BUZ38_01185 [Staphylococcus haemolyticus]PTK76101.1 hypothetical protein BUZ24_04730 [Staphylococcus haemolyticus]PTK98358.1 hypothetical protein BUZ19_00960 [Staphylococcus haemolyticus]RIO68663.1 hypothetical protein BUZ22_03175 [Staphylococcus haemolyticus]
MKYNFNEVINFILLLGLSAFTFSRGFFFTKEQDAVLSDSDFYVALHHIMPIWAWGIIIMIASIILGVSSFFLPRQKTNNTCNWLLLIGGTICSVLYFFMTSASIYNAINWLSTIQFSILSAVCFAVGFIGGADIYDRR